VTREQLAHVLRAASTIASERDVLVIGSQSLLASFDETELPYEATASMEADVAFFDDPGDTKADRVDGAIGELSDFHETFGYYAQGVSVTTAVLPDGWRDRVISFEGASTTPGRGLCLDPHDCVLSKLVAGREKDLAFSSALVRSQLISLDILAEGLSTVPADPIVLNRMQIWIDAHRK
jgi:hypothetical protein